MNSLNVNERIGAVFTEKEVAYLKSQRLARIATVSPDAQPDVAPVGFELDGDSFYIGGMNLPATHKYKNIDSGNAKVAIVVDDLESIDPWNPRGIRVYGSGEIVEREGQFGPGIYMRVTPAVSWSWNIEGPAFVDGRFAPNRTEHSAA